MPNVAEYEKRRKKIEWKRGGRSSERGAQKRKRPRSPASSPFFRLSGGGFREGRVYESSPDSRRRYGGPWGRVEKHPSSRVKKRQQQMGRTGKRKWVTTDPCGGRTGLGGTLPPHVSLRRQRPRRRQRAGVKVRVWTKRTVAPVHMLPKRYDQELRLRRKGQI